MDLCAFGNQAEDNPPRPPTGLDDDHFDVVGSEHGRKALEGVGGARTGRGYLAVERRHVELRTARQRSLICVPALVRSSNRAV
jgi:hypothetical protein